MRKLLLQHVRAPGDILVMTALVRDIVLTYPDQFEISVNTTAGEIWRNNPYTRFTKQDTTQTDVELIRLNYKDTIDQVGSRNKHFLFGFHENFEKQTGIRVPLLYPWPDYHLSEEEKTTPLVSGRYWVIISGGKSDFITKHWVYKRSQQVVNLLKQMDVHCVQIGAIGQSKDLYHYHPRLENTLCMVGLTTLRDMARIIYHAEGVICPVTAAMHFAAAMHKPCVVIAGGREEWWWEAYVPRLGNFGTELREDVRVPHRFLHTIGQLDCCKSRGCWRNTVEFGDRVCYRQVNVGGQITPVCQELIKVEHVIEAVMSYYEEGRLPPVGTPRPIAVVDGKPRLLRPDEPIPPQTSSAFADALTLPEPRLLTETTGIKVMTGEAVLAQ
jgi:hypothetical protein